MGILRNRRSAGRGPLALTTAAFALASAAGGAAQLRCTGGGNTIGIAIDGSGSVGVSSFNTVTRQIANFIDSTSGLAPASGTGTANENLYYANVWDTGVRATTGGFATNAGGAVSTNVRAFTFPSGGGTVIEVGLNDLTAKFAALTPDASARIGILFTDGSSSGNTLGAANRLRAEGVTVAAVGIGSGVVQSVLEDIADSSDLVFRTANFGNIGDLFDDVIKSIDSDGDGTSDCDDECPTDPAKTMPGDCGCGVAETDSDSDGTPDCNDECPTDPAKTMPGDCGCGVAETDSDSDGTPDCNDECPTDPAKTMLGDCGCGVAETDSDSDGTPDCNDDCPADPAKTMPGDCGCGKPETCKKFGKKFGRKFSHKFGSKFSHKFGSKFGSKFGGRFGSKSSRKFGKKFGRRSAKKY